MKEIRFICGLVMLLPFCAFATLRIVRARKIIAASAKPYPKMEGK